MRSIVFFSNSKKEIITKLSSIHKNYLYIELSLYCSEYMDEHFKLGAPKDKSIDNKSKQSIANTSIVCKDIMINTRK